METATGTVNAISEKLTKNGKKRYGYLVGVEWFNSFKPFKVVKGQKVEVTFESTGYGNQASNIVEHKEEYFEPSPKAPPTQIEPTIYPNREKLIVRQSCLKAAIETLAGTEAGHSTLEIKKIAKEYEEFIYE